MIDKPFVRVRTGKNADTLHAAKEQYPNESVCGWPLAPDPVNPRGRRKCQHCETSLRNLKTENSK